MSHITNKTIQALLWSFLEAFGIQGIRFVFWVVLGRLLFPEQFGLIGMLAIFTAVTQTFIDSGFGAALIQKREVTQIDKCSIFYFNIFVGLVTAGLLCLLAPWIAAFYKQPILNPLTRALSLTLVINSFGMIQNSMLTRQIDFKARTIVSLIAGVSSGIVGITLAVLDFGVWSLVAQQISAAFFSTVCLWVLSPWRPALIFSLSALKEMFGFGSRLLLSEVLNQVFENTYYTVIGKLFSANDLGFFTRAKTLNDLPSQTLSGMVGRVAFPVFSNIQNDRVLLKRGMKKALTTLALVNFPIMIGMAIVARPMVYVLLTEKWAESIRYLQLFSVLGLMLPLHVINLNLLQALGRSDLFLRLEVIKKALIVINIAVTWRWGICAMIWGMIAVSAMSYYVNSYYTGVLIDYSIKEQLRDLISYLAVSLLMGIGVLSIELLPFSSDWSMLTVQATSGLFIYVLLCRICRLTAFVEAWQIGCDRMSFLRSGMVGQK